MVDNAIIQTQAGTDLPVLAGDRLENHCWNLMMENLLAPYDFSFVRKDAPRNGTRMR